MHEWRYTVPACPEAYQRASAVFNQHVVRSDKKFLRNIWGIWLIHTLILVVCAIVIGSATGKILGVASVLYDADLIDCADILYQNANSILPTIAVTIVFFLIKQKVAMRYYLHHVYHRGYLMNSNQFIANEQGVQNIYTADEKQQFV